MILPVLHFIWINGSRDFGAGEYASILSALLNTSYDVVLHTDLKPRSIKTKYNPYKLKDSRFSIHYQVFETVIDGVRLRLANVSDIYRILFLYEFGGMYSDLDILWVKDVELDLRKHKVVAGWENPTYKTITNAWIGCQKHYGPLKALLTQFHEAIRALKTKGITDITGPDQHKYHVLLFYMTRDFLKGNCDAVIPKAALFKNGWRRIARAFRKSRIPFLHEEQIPPSTTDDDLNFDGICGFHYWNSFFPFESLIKLPAVKAAFSTLLSAMPSH
jgi:hypothetical protein